MKKSIIVLLLIVAALLIIIGYSLFYPLGPAPKAKTIMALTASDLQLSALDGIKVGLAELGYVEGVDYLLEIFNPKGSRDLTREMAEKIVAAKPDVIVSISTTASTMVKQANVEAKIPVVFVDVGNLEQLDITNLQMPGGFMTGLAVDNVPLSPKRMELLKELIPDLREVAILLNSEHVSYQIIKKVHDKGAEALGITPIYYDVTKEDDLPAVLAKIAKDRPQAFMTTTEAIISGNAEMIASVLKEAKIPSIDFNAEKGVGSGYLMMYGITRFGIGRQGSHFIDKVLRGQNPGEIPVEFAGVPTLELNAAVARDIGVSFPQSLLLRAKTIVE